MNALPRRRPGKTLVSEAKAVGSTAYWVDVAPTAVAPIRAVAAVQQTSDETVANILDRLREMP